MLCSDIVVFIVVLDPIDVPMVRLPQLSILWGIFHDCCDPFSTLVIMVYTYSACDCPSSSDNAACWQRHMEFVWASSENCPWFIVVQFVLRFLVCLVAVRCLYPITTTCRWPRALYDPSCQVRAPMVPLVHVVSTLHPTFHRRMISLALCISWHHALCLSMCPAFW